ncbi:MAG: undecaprenyl-diphosphate phosphatase [Thermomicrobiales bacterium]|nr:undecaprenyl-diphosphate phosphatase [Thermomicrobiales bacterium]MCO5223325.1 UDP-diphosphatase [Thermomicrobiales bacterium]
MSWLEAIILGITQGLTEFLPISSSGHLIIVPWLFGWETPGLAFDASLHLGTLVAVFAYFWRDLIELVRAIPTIVRKNVSLLKSPAVGEADDTFYARLGVLLVLGSIPGGIVGLLFESRIDRLFHSDTNENRSIVIIAVLLAFFAILLWIADRAGSEQRLLRSIRVPDALIIGAAQAIALMPGTSRSGVTLTAGLFRDFNRADAARFSFLLGIPLVTFAGLTGVVDLLRSDLTGQELARIGAGMIASAISGFIAIRFLLRFLQTRSTGVFVVYRLVAAVVLIGLVASGFR